LFSSEIYKNFINKNKEEDKNNIETTHNNNQKINNGEIYLKKHALYIYDLKVSLKIAEDTLNK